MNILLIAGFFPPYSPPSATRAPALARYLLARGHDVRVIGYKMPDVPVVLQPGLPEGIAHYADRSDVAGAGFGSRLACALGRELDLPDRRAVWIGPTRNTARRILKSWQADLIYATAPPMSCALAAQAVAAEHGIPWVCEFRDLWTGHPYYTPRPLLGRIEKHLERKMISSAAGVVTVTQGWAEGLKADFARPTACILNGYEATEFAEQEAPPPGKLTLLYAGALYGAKRDPSPLFAALERLGDRRRGIEAQFLVEAPEQVLQRARAYGIADCLNVTGLIPRSEVLSRLGRTDLLLLLRWDDPSEDHVLAGKLFEYIGAGRPILSVGGTTGEAADIIRDNGFGVVSREPDEIAAALGRWLDEKHSGGIPGLDEMRRARFDRNVQFDELMRFLDGQVLSQ